MLIIHIFFYSALPFEIQLNIHHIQIKTSAACPTKNHYLLYNININKSS